MRFFKFLRILLAFISLSAMLILFIGGMQGVSTSDYPWIWLASIQIAPVIAALNWGVLIVHLGVALLFGRVYCSIVCPLGIAQDFFSWLRPKKWRKKTSKFSHQKSMRALEIAKHIFMLFWGLSFVFGMSILFRFFDPYAIFGRFIAGAKGIVEMAETTEILESGFQSFVILGFSLIPFLIIALIAFFTGREYCTRLCPVGTLLGIFSRFSIFRLRIDPQKCRHCLECARQCKSHCIDVQKKCAVDASRCVVCFNCLSACKFHAIAFGRNRTESFGAPPTKGVAKENLHEPQKASDKSQTKSQNSNETPHKAQPQTVNVSRRDAFKIGAQTLAWSIPCLALPNAFAGDKKPEYALAEVSRKQPIARVTPILPPGAWNRAMFARRCTGCTLCVQSCKNRILTLKSSVGRHIFQPEMTFERGYCRPSCTQCGDVCPTHAIQAFSVAQKRAVRIGLATLHVERCVNTTTSFDCRACGRMCPNHAISWGEAKRKNDKDCLVPVVDATHCVGCGACEYVCAARPMAAIVVTALDKPSFDSPL